MDTWNRKLFKQRYVDAGGSMNSARSYVRYLNRAERVLGGLSDIEAAHGGEELIARAEQLPRSAWGDERARSDSLSALRKFIVLCDGTLPPCESKLKQMAIVPLEGATVTPMTAEVMALLAEAQSLGARYYCATGKPLGVTGEVAELEAARKLGLNLCDARTSWYDAIDPADHRRVQIKGRAINRQSRAKGMVPAIRCGDEGSDEVDDVVLVLLDRSNLEAIAIWRATIPEVVAKVAGLTSPRRRKSGTLGVSQFCSFATKVWTIDS